MHQFIITDENGSQRQVSLPDDEGPEAQMREGETASPVDSSSPPPGAEVQL